MPQLIILVGPPCSGKTTFINDFLTSQGIGAVEDFFTMNLASQPHQQAGMGGSLSLSSHGGSELRGGKWVIVNESDLARQGGGLHRRNKTVWRAMFPSAPFGYNSAAAAASTTSPSSAPHHHASSSSSSSSPSATLTPSRESLLRKGACRNVIVDGNNGSSLERKALISYLRNELKRFPSSCAPASHHAAAAASTNSNGKATTNNPPPFYGGVEGMQTSAAVAGAALTPTPTTFTATAIHNKTGATGQSMDGLPEIAVTIVYFEDVLRGRGGGLTHTANCEETKPSSMVASPESVSKKRAREFFMFGSGRARRLLFGYRLADACLTMMASGLAASTISTVNDAVPRTTAATENNTSNNNTAVKSRRLSSSSLFASPSAASTTSAIERPSAAEGFNCLINVYIGDELADTQRSEHVGNTVRRAILNAAYAFDSSPTNKTSPRPPPSLLGLNNGFYSHHRGKISALFVPAQCMVTYIASRRHVGMARPVIDARMLRAIWDWCGGGTDNRRAVIITGTVGISAAAGGEGVRGDKATSGNRSTTHTSTSTPPATTTATAVSFKTIQQLMEGLRLPIPIFSFSAHMTRYHSAQQQLHARRGGGMSSTMAARSASVASAPSAATQFATGGGGKEGYVSEGGGGQAGSNQTTAEDFLPLDSCSMAYLERLFNLDVMNCVGIVSSPTKARGGRGGQGEGHGQHESSSSSSHKDNNFYVRCLEGSGGNGARQIAFSGQREMKGHDQPTAEIGKIKPICPQQLYGSHFGFPCASVTDFLANPLGLIPESEMQACKEILHRVLSSSSARGQGHSNAAPPGRASSNVLGTKKVGGSSFLSLYTCSWVDWSAHPCFADGNRRMRNKPTDAIEHPFGNMLSGRLQCHSADMPCLFSTELSSAAETVDAASRREDQHQHQRPVLGQFTSPALSKINNVTETLAHKSSAVMAVLGGGGGADYLAVGDGSGGSEVGPCMMARENTRAFPSNAIRTTRLDNGSVNAQQQRGMAASSSDRSVVALPSSLLAAKTAGLPIPPPQSHPHSQLNASQEHNQHSHCGRRDGRGHYHSTVFDPHCRYAKIRHKNAEEEEEDSTPNESETENDIYGANSNNRNGDNSNNAAVSDDSNLSRRSAYPHSNTRMAPAFLCDLTSLSSSSLFSESALVHGRAYAEAGQVCFIPFISPDPSSTTCCSDRSPDSIILGGPVPYRQIVVGLEECGGLWGRWETDGKEPTALTHSSVSAHVYSSDRSSRYLVTLLLASQGMPVACYCECGTATAIYGGNHCRHGAALAFILCQRPRTTIEQEVAEAAEAEKRSREAEKTSARGEKSEGIKTRGAGSPEDEDNAYKADNGDGRGGHNQAEATVVENISGAAARSQYVPTPHLVTLVGGIPHTLLPKGAAGRRAYIRDANATGITGAPTSAAGGSGGSGCGFGSGSVVFRVLGAHGIPSRKIPLGPSAPTRRPLTAYFWFMRKSLASEEDEETERNGSVVDQKAKSSGKRREAPNSNNNDDVHTVGNANSADPFAAVLRSSVFSYPPAPPDHPHRAEVLHHARGGTTKSLSNSNGNAEEVEYVGASFGSSTEDEDSDGTDRGRAPIDTIIGGNGKLLLGESLPANKKGGGTSPTTSTNSKRVRGLGDESIIGSVFDFGQHTSSALSVAVRSPRQRHQHPFTEVEDDASNHEEREEGGGEQGPPPTKGKKRVTEVTKALAEKWRALTKEEKERFESECAVYNAAVKSEWEAYKATAEYSSAIEAHVKKMAAAAADEDVDRAPSTAVGGGGVASAQINTKSGQRRSGAQVGSKRSRGNAGEAHDADAETEDEEDVRPSSVSKSSAGLANTKGRGTASEHQREGANSQWRLNRKGQWVCEWDESDDEEDTSNYENNSVANVSHGRSCADGQQAGLRMAGTGDKRPPPVLGSLFGGTDSEYQFAATRNTLFASSGDTLAPQMTTRGSMLAALNQRERERELADDRERNGLTTLQRGSTRIYGDDNPNGNHHHHHVKDDGGDSRRPRKVHSADVTERGRLVAKSFSQSIAARPSSAAAAASSPRLCRETATCKETTTPRLNQRTYEGNGTTDDRTTR